MSTTTFQGPQATVAVDGTRNYEPPAELMRTFNKLLTRRRFSWTAHPRLGRPLGQGGQGVVYLSERKGADGFTVPIALKVFSPERYESASSYQLDMARIARVSSRVAQIQHDNLLGVQDFFDRNQIRIMAMEWVDGSDVRSLLNNDLLARIRGRVSANRWEYINRVILTKGPVQPQVKPGVAIAIVRDCLEALGALHRNGVVHGDVKPGNIMLKRTGHAKIIDIGSAFDQEDPPAMRMCTPSYASTEVLEGHVPDGRSDLASLGYVLVELLAGRPLFPHAASYQDLIEAKRSLHQKLETMLPQEVACNNLLMNFCRKLIAPDPSARFPNAETAELVKGGAAAFHRQLVISDLASEYDNEIRLWLEEVKELEAFDSEADTMPQ